uniref:Nucleotide-diphospho-sugar transferase domain-containing protein n=1 Tax=Craspedostauros australis TaxID=1486917 RepID=A0A7S0F720_9STRA|mmetsp:Transcript_9996/g.27336  ORF Transcript_9996/g.27336 Transcript_9996/m.27336 type:complete len:389 (+) Transcript_9996:142-1308(+)|eukprot:CAMPEP_0198113136 /NCGR_PEP_ID=MMETSP1442-20131203/4880_1 /TAXON_ID= /ORGANISM="Craspedostauros australis, Strain CCMP3328" /LENGTH=388 /DNA_ID=CAMNT_0043770147 /DNA_START=135 /DNA_END=1301 /DNA_ORIENTATION=-
MTRQLGKIAQSRVVRICALPLLVIIAVLPNYSLLKRYNSGILVPPPTDPITVADHAPVETTPRQQQQQRQQYPLDGPCIDPDVHWRIVVAGNYGYREDFLNWYIHCVEVGMCPATPEQRDQHAPHSTNSNDGCPPMRYANVVLYAEDRAMYGKYLPSKLIDVKKAWDVGSKFNDIRMGFGRFGYPDGNRFRHMMSHRPSILINELGNVTGAAMTGELDPDVIANEIGSFNVNSSRLLFIDLDTIMLKDPRPHMRGDYDFWAADAKSNTSGPYNAGLIVMRPTPASISCIRRWRSYLEGRPRANYNQLAFNHVVRKMGDKIRHKLLDDALFPVGAMFKVIGEENVNEHTLNKDVVVLHNNHCDRNCSKPERAKKMGLWREKPSINMYLS